MANINGLPVNSAVTHAEFMSRTEDTSTTGIVNFQNTTESSDPTTGAIKTAGGMGVEKSLNVGLGATVGGELIVTGETTLNDTLNAANIVAVDISGSQVDAPIGNITTVNATTVNTADLNLTNALTVPSLSVTSDAVINGNLTVNGTTTTLNTATVDSEDPNITLNKNGNDLSSEGSGLTIDRTGTKGSFQYQNTLASKFKCGDLGAEDEIATVTAVQTFNNKSIDGVGNTLTNIPASALTGSVAINKGGTGQTTQTAAFDALSPLTTKGDLIVNNGTNDVRLAVGTNTHVLTADSSEPSGVKWAAASGGSGVPTITKLTSGSGATYTTPVGATYLRIRMVGGGGGGSSTGTSGTFAGQTGADSTFGSSLLTAVGGGGGQIGAGGFVGGSGGSVTINSPAINIASVTGSQGGAASGTLASNISGGNGGSSYFGGSGGSNIGTAAGRNAATNSGSGGGAPGSTSGNTGGAGGGSGGYLEALISAPSASYVYTVGSGGNGGSAGVSGFAGGNGGSGVIIIEEYY